MRRNFRGGRHHALTAAKVLPRFTERKLRESAGMKKMRKNKIPLLFISTALVIAVTATGAYAAPRYVTPLGYAVGIDVKTDGVLVVALSGAGGGESPSPAAKAGIEAGDLITVMGGKEINCAGDFQTAAAELTGEPVNVSVSRQGQSLELILTPCMDSGGPELGMWLRDGVSGVGTLTFYDGETGRFAGLGHGISDADSGVMIPLGSGSIFNATVAEVKKGTAGVPGELCGVFDISDVCGELTANTPFGVFGNASAELKADAKPIPVAEQGDITLGKAEILTNVSGKEIKSYEVEIERVYHGDAGGRSLMLCVTDPELLELTGGIVQGMSGSPIIQNGALIGAVTHVMVNDPKRGFGIAAGLMLEHCGAGKKSDAAA